MNAYIGKHDTIVLFFLSLSSGEEGRAIPAEERTTTPYMTKYERARILGTRALQIR